MARTFSPGIAVIEDAGRIEIAKRIIGRLSRNQIAWKQLNKVETNFIQSLSLAGLKGAMRVTPKQLVWLRKIEERVCKKEDA